MLEIEALRGCQSEIVREPQNPVCLRDRCSVASGYVLPRALFKMLTNSIMEGQAKAMSHFAVQPDLRPKKTSNCTCSSVLLLKRLYPLCVREPNKLCTLSRDCNHYACIPLRVPVTAKCVVPLHTEKKVFLFCTIKCLPHSGAIQYHPLYTSHAKP